MAWVFFVCLGFFLFTFFFTTSTQKYLLYQDVEKGKASCLYICVAGTQKHSALNLNLLLEELSKLF